MSGGVVGEVVALGIDGGAAGEEDIGEVGVGAAVFAEDGGVEFGGSGVAEEGDTGAGGGGFVFEDGAVAEFQVAAVGGDDGAARGTAGDGGIFGEGDVFEEGVNVVEIESAAAAGGVVVVESGVGDGEANVGGGDGCAGGDFAIGEGEAVERECVIGAAEAHDAAGGRAGEVMPPLERLVASMRGFADDHLGVLTAAGGVEVDGVAGERGGEEDAAGVGGGGDGFAQGGAEAAADAVVFVGAGGDEEGFDGFDGAAVDAVDGVVEVAVLGAVEPPGVEGGGEGRGGGIEAVAVDGGAVDEGVMGGDFAAVPGEGADAEVGVGEARVEDVNIGDVIEGGVVGVIEVAARGDEVGGIVVEVFDSGKDEVFGEEIKAEGDGRGEVVVVDGGASVERTVATIAVKSGVGYFGRESEAAHREGRAGADREVSREGGRANDETAVFEFRDGPGVQVAVGVFGEG